MNEARQTARHWSGFLSSFAEYLRAQQATTRGSEA